MYVDAVTGATNSSRVIMHAVYDALEQAVRKSVKEPQGRVSPAHEKG